MCNEDEYCGAWIPEEMKEDFIKEFANREYNFQIANNDRGN